MRCRCWRHAAGIAVLAVAASLCFASSATAEEPLSEGCEALNDPVYDAQYNLMALDGTTFAAHERITITGSTPSSGDPTAILLAAVRPDNEVVTLIVDFPGTVEYTLPLDGSYPIIWGIQAPSNATATFEVSCVATAPDCSTVTATPTVLKVDGKLQQVALSGATDPQGEAITYLITGVSQDEPTTGGFRNDLKAPDANGLSANKVSLRGERNPSLNGRVYRIAYTVTDEAGFTCSGIATVGVAAKKGVAAVDDGEQASWNSFTGVLMP